MARLRSIAMALGMIGTFGLGVPLSLMSQTVTPNSSRGGQPWMATAPAVPEFIAPATVGEWSKRRLEIRAQLEVLLGHLPPRPQVPATRTLRRVQHDGYVEEQIEFDNGGLTLDEDAAMSATIKY